MSTKIERRLNEQGIEVCGFFVDSEYDHSDTTADGRVVYSLDELRDKQEEINVVIGHGHYENRAKISKLPFVHKVFIIANPYLQYCSTGIEEWIEQNGAEYRKIVGRLADDQSRNALHAYCMVSKTNDIEYLMDKDFLIQSIFDFEKLELTDKERYVDAGAWIGDTIESFRYRTGNQYDHIYAVEPDPESLESLKNIMTYKDIAIYPCGLGKLEGVLFLDVDAEVRESTRLTTERGQPEQINVKVNTIDGLFENESISLMKICVPFAFLDVLQGGKKCFLKDRPRLIVNIALENGTHFFEVIKWVMDLNVGYEVALRFDMPMPTRLWMFAY